MLSLQSTRGLGTACCITAVALLVVISISLGIVSYRPESRYPANDENRMDEETRPISAVVQEEIRKLAASDNPDVLNVHIVPHTHDDVGWLKTVEEYYYGLNNTIQHACVRDILDSVVQALMDNPARTFTYVEQKFFSMWWKEQPDAVKDSVRFLVANQQLSFANGGWCMHDEAGTLYHSMIDQTTLGHEFLVKQLGVRPSVGWQLDPFGHSATQSSLMTARLFDSIVFGRIDAQDLEIRHATKECEGLWASSAASKSDSTVFWTLSGSYSGNYGAVKNFCFDMLCHDDLLLDMNKTQLVERINMFVNELKDQSDRSKGHNILLTMGEDFNYQRGNTYFANLDVLVGAVMKFQRWGLIDVSSIMGPRFKRVNVFYSSPAYYTQMKHKETVTYRERELHPSLSEPQISTKTHDMWSVKTDDFFPYSDCDHCFWAGYFTSRAGFKRMERVGSSFLLAARQIEARYGDSSELEPGLGRSAVERPFYDLEDALGISQHHDAISGTAKQHVANDYSRRLQAGIDTSSSHIVKYLNNLFVNTSSAGRAFNDLTFCQLVNETKCEVSQEATKDVGTDIYLIVYNPLGSNRSSIVRLPVCSETVFNVSRLDNAVAPQNGIRSIRCPFVSSTPVLTFNTGPLPPVGATIFRISVSNMQHPGQNSISNELHPGYSNMISESRGLSDNFAEETITEELHVTNGFLTVSFDRVSGMMKSITKDGTTVNVSQAWGYYISYDNKIDKPTDNSTRGDQNGGAYIFRPSSPNQTMHLLGFSGDGIRMVRTAAGIEIIASFRQSWLKQVTRIEKGLPYVEVEYQIGPIPIWDGRGKDVVTRFSTSINSNATFYTDSNGREFIQRRRDFRPTWPLKVFEPIAGNYYPVNAGIYIQDNNASLAILVDRSQGAASITDGSIELMAQRRTLADDSRGVGEPLNETDGGVTPYPPYGNATRFGTGLIVRGKYRIMVGGGFSGAKLARSQMDDIYTEPPLFVASAPSNHSIPFLRYSFSGLQSALPSNVMLLTFKKLDDDGNHLIRLGHQYSINEHETLSKPVQIDLSRIFFGFKLVAAVEMTLTGNQKYNDWVDRRLDWTGSGPLPESTVNDNNTTVNMKPMDIRTFIIKLHKNDEAQS